MMGRGNTESQVCSLAPSSCRTDEQNEHAVVVSRYFLDVFEVTVGRLRKFVEQYDGQPLPEGTGAHPKIPGSGWNTAWDTAVPPKSTLIASLGLHDSMHVSTWTPTPGANELLPATNLDWLVAFMFCVWDGGRLPTEAEWEYAAAGGEENRIFPWGNTQPDDAHAFYGANLDTCLFDGNSACTVDDIFPVGSKPLGAGRFGHLDLAGSVFEPVFDAYDPHWYSNSSAVGTDPANPVPTMNRVIRGGSWRSAWPDLRSTNREYLPIGSMSRVVGVRCARD